MKLLNKIIAFFSAMNVAPVPSITKSPASLHLRCTANESDNTCGAKQNKKVARAAFVFFSAGYCYLRLKVR